MLRFRAATGETEDEILRIPVILVGSVRQFNHFMRVVTVTADVFTDLIFGESDVDFGLVNGHRNELLNS